MSSHARMLALALLAGVIAVSSALAGSGSQSFTVSSTLDGKTVLPHRIHWLANPKLPSKNVAEVIFLIDGKVSWIEHSAPYTYGDDGDWLVTSFLRPGLHHFKVQVTSTDGRQAVDTTTARVLPAAAPPAQLAGKWKRTLTAAEAGAQPAGTWVLTVDRVGWKLTVPPGGAAWVDVAYLPGGMLQSRGGIWTKPRPNEPFEGNGWCEDTNTPVNYRWSVAGSTLTLALAGHDGCNDGKAADDESVIWAGAWTRVG